MLYERPAGLWISVCCGSSSAHSYHTRCSLHTRHMASEMRARASLAATPAGGGCTRTGERSGNIIGNQLTIRGVGRFGWMPALSSGTQWCDAQFAQALTKQMLVHTRTSIVIEWHWQRYKVSAMHKSIHCSDCTTLQVQSIISVPAGKAQAGRTPNSRETSLSSSRDPIGAIWPDRRHFYYYNYFMYAHTHNHVAVEHAFEEAWEAVQYALPRDRPRDHLKAAVMLAGTRNNRFRAWHIY